MNIYKATCPYRYNSKDLDGVFPSYEVFIIAPTIMEAANILAASATTEGMFQNLARSESIELIGNNIVMRGQAYLGNN